MKMRVADGALDGDDGKSLPVEVEAAVGVLERRQNEAADSAGDQDATEAGRRHAVAPGPEVLQLVAIGARSRRGAGEQALGTLPSRPIVASGPVGNERYDGKFALDAQALPVGGKGAAGRIGSVIE